MNNRDKYKDRQRGSRNKSRIRSHEARQVIVKGTDLLGAGISASQHQAVLTQITDSELDRQPIRKGLSTLRSHNKSKMASTLSRALPRLVSSLHTTPILSRPRSHKALARTITSFHGLQGLAQPWRVPTEEAPELVESGELALHLEALQRWHDEAELLREARVLPPGVDDQINLEAETRDQVKDLMETLIEEEILDVRRGWVLASNY
ncbi:uncharacterized protein LOC125044061 [Penaeus chinensis]|uniref:uncharacterized protein LOC125044061 n=1 Tax=Penaeus chinensis TaxID=139456 RepID=UPI001FB5A14A|nr:uncharacterized protein LOC125044061 [Penaeus chinensis]